MQQQAMSKATTARTAAPTPIPIISPVVRPVCVLKLLTGEVCLLDELEEEELEDGEELLAVAVEPVGASTPV
jgi:hypothetical protein